MKVKYWISKIFLVASFSQRNLTSFPRLRLQSSENNTQLSSPVVNFFTTEATHQESTQEIQTQESCCFQEIPPKWWIQLSWISWAVEKIFNSSPCTVVHLQCRVIWVEYKWVEVLHSHWRLVPLVSAKRRRQKHWPSSSGIFYNIGPASLHHNGVQAPLRRYLLVKVPTVQHTICQQ